MTSKTQLDTKQEVQRKEKKRNASIVEQTRHTLLLLRKEHLIQNGTAILTKRDGYARSATEIISSLNPIL